MTAKRFAYSAPRIHILRWLIDPCVDVAPRIKDSLRDGLFASPWTLLIAALNALMLNGVALIVDGGTKFALLIALDLSLVAVRLQLFRRMRENASKGMPTSTDLYLSICIGWCAVQGAIGFCCMRTGIASLQVICVMTTAGLVGPICMRNFGTPRFALLLVGSSLGPLVCAAVQSSNPWLLILGLQAPASFYGAARMLTRMQALLVSSLQAEHDSQERARRDVLTGLLNRAGLAEALGEIKAPLVDPLVCLYLDLDGFKKINDVHGHQAGDEVLKLVAKRLSAVADNRCLVARLGGDEFVILALMFSPDRGHALAQKIVRSVGETPYEISGVAPLQIGISVGFACAPDDGREQADLARMADAALYKAKFAGKNTQRRYDPNWGVATGGPEWPLPNSAISPSAVLRPVPEVMAQG